MNYENPINAADRARDWPPGHDVGVFVSVGEVLTLVGTARERSDANVLFGFLAEEFGQDELAEDFFSEVLR